MTWIDPADGGGNALATGETLERRGDWLAAAETYQRLVEQRPDDPEALFRLGRTLGRLGQADLAQALVGQAIARAPTAARYHAHLGDLLLVDGHPRDAAECFEAALAADPCCDDARAGLGEALLDLGRAGEVDALVGAGLGKAWRERRVAGRLLLARGEPRAAADALVDHLRACPTDATAYFYLGVALQAIDLLEPAAVSYREAVRLNPDLFEAHTNLSTVLRALGDFKAATDHADQAVRLEPTRAGLLLNRANARRDGGDLEGAGDDYRAAVAVDPEYAEAWSSLANLYHDLAEWALALDAHDRAVRLAPGLPQARWNRSFTRLATGRLAEGWEDYEFRLATAAASPEPRGFPWPTWAGEPVAGRSILVWREQGLGDEVRFLSCVQDLVGRGAEVALLVSPRLVSLVRRSIAGVRILPDEPGAVSATDGFDLQVPMGSLPRWLRSSREAFGSGSPWMLPDPSQVAKWRRRLATLGPGPRIGLCWRSGLVTPERRRHYPPLEAWGPVLATPAVWVNLQYDECRDDLDQLERRFGVAIRRWPEEDLRHDLESVAGLLAALDGIVSAPTAVAALGGAVGSPTWQVDSGSDWTALGEDRSPWSSSVRVVRRPVGSKDWEPVMLAVGQALRARISGGEGRRG